jgi:hypothetical protein
MSSELLYTSAPQGLKAGNRGFTTVLCTAGMPPNLADKLESFSGYKHVYSPQDPLADNNPVRYAYLRPNIGGRAVSVVSRLAAYGVDYSGRSNKIAHHIVLEPVERPSGGPAWLISQTSLWKTSWDGSCRTVPTGPKIPSGDQAPEICQSWKQLTGDAGWGGQVATWLQQSNKPIWLIYAPEQQSQMLKLIAEVLALLPAEERWMYTFATYFSGLPGDVDCRIRGVVSGSDEARLASARGHVIDLAKPGALASMSVLIEGARTGNLSLTPPPARHTSPPELGLPNDRSLPDDQFNITPESPAVARVDSTQTSTPNETNPESLSSTDGQGYRLQPPPTPTHASNAAFPPMLPGSFGDSTSNNLFSLRWLVAAVTGGLALLIVTGAAIITYVRPSDLNKVSLANKPAGLDTVSDSDARDNLGDRSVGQPESRVEQENSEVHSEKEKDTQDKEGDLPDLIVELKEENRASQKWSQREPNSLIIKLKENFIGPTNYQVKTNLEMLHVRFDTDALSIGNDGLVTIVKQQDFEKTPKMAAKLIVEKGTKEMKINFEIEIENHIKVIETKKIKRRFNYDKNNKVIINLRQEEYSDEIDDEVENFDFEIVETSNGSEPDDNLGTLVKDGSMLIYSIDEKAISKFILKNNKKSWPKTKTDDFRYRITCSRCKNSVDVISIEIEIPEQEQFAFLKATTRDGKTINFTKDDVSHVINKVGEYRLQFRKKTEPIGASLSRTFVKNGNFKKPSPRLDDSDSWPGVGKLILDPLKGGKLTFDSDFEIGKRLRKVVSVQEYFLEILVARIEPQLKYPIDQVALALSLGPTPTPEQVQNRVQQEQARRMALENVLASINKIRKDGNSIKEKKTPVGKGEMDLSIEDYLSQDVKTEIDSIVKEVGIGEIIKSEIEQLAKQTIAEIEETVSFLKDCVLVVEKDK